MNTNRTLSSIMNNEALEYAHYTVSSRAIPNMIDGLKPVQRFVLYCTLKNAKTDYKKVAALAGNVSEAGYLHGEVSAQESLKLLASDWNNNIPIVQGRGNFGSRMVQESAAARYVYAKIHDNFNKYFTDVSLSPKHEDPEHIPPKFYIPIVPLVLANGIQGIATGFATHILPHDPEWIMDAVKEYITHGDITSEPVVNFPSFDGEIRKLEDNKYLQVGNFEVSGLTVTITEIPTHFDHSKYCAFLDSLQASGKITTWKDETSDSFRFVVRMRRGNRMRPETDIIGPLRLAKTYSQNINVINEKGNLKTYNDVRDLIADFVEYRMEFLNLRIKDGLEMSLHRKMLADARYQFIQMVLHNRILIKGKKRRELVHELEQMPVFKGFGESVISLPMDKMTTDELEKLLKIAQQADQEHTYWKTTTSRKEYLKDLRNLKKSVDTA